MELTMATTTVECTNCERTARTIVPVAPPDLRADYRDAQRARDQLGACPSCHDVNLVAVQRDLFGRVIRES